MLPKEYRREQKKRKRKQTSQQLEQHNYIAGLKKYLNRQYTYPRRIPYIKKTKLISL